MKTFVAAILLTAGFTVSGTVDESLWLTGAILIGKLALIFSGGMLLVNKMEKEEL